MGCHTWFYKKIKSPSYDDIKNSVISVIEYDLMFLDKFINDRNSIDKDLLDCYYELTPEYAKKYILFWDKVMISIKNDTIDKKQLYDYYCRWNSKPTKFVDGRGFYEETKYHDLFRKYDYPDDMLFSFEETLSYINKKENNCVVYDYSFKKLKEFWNKYPNGMIQFG